MHCTSLSPMTKKKLLAGSSSLASLTLTTPSEDPVMITLLGSHSYMVEKDTHRICCWGEWAPRAVLTVATGEPLMLHTCSQVPAQVAMSPCKVHSQIHKEIRTLKGYTGKEGAHMMPVSQPTHSSSWAPMIYYLPSPTLNLSSKYMKLNCIYINSFTWGGRHSVP